MSNLHITLYELALKPLGAQTDVVDDSLLGSTLYIAGLPCQFKAYQVIRDDTGVLYVVNQQYAEEFKAVMALANNAPMTLSVNDIEYVIALSAVS